MYLVRYVCAFLETFWCEELTTLTRRYNGRDVH